MLGSRGRRSGNPDSLGGLGPEAIVPAVRRWAIAAAAVLVLVPVGCDRNDEQGDSRMVRTGNQDVERRADGSLERSPPPLTIAEVRRERRGSPRAAVMELLFWAQWGSAPNVVGAYDPRVLATVGASRVVGALAYLREQLVASQPRITETLRRGSVVFLAVELARQGAPPQTESFSLRRVRGDWKIVFDTLLERGLNTYASFRHPGRSPDGSPDAAAQRAGDRAAQRYRNAFVSMRLTRRVPAPTRTRTPTPTPTPTPQTAAP